MEQSSIQSKWIQIHPQASLTTQKFPLVSLLITYDNPMIFKYACAWNACSIINQLSAFQSYVYGQDFCIVAITETWLNSFIIDNEILSFGFNLYRKDCTTRGEGVMLAVSNSFFPKLLFSLDNLELLTTV